MPAYLNPRFIQLILQMFRNPMVATWEQNEV